MSTANKKHTNHTKNTAGTTSTAGTKNTTAWVKELKESTFSYSEERLNDILALLEETGDYRNIEIQRGLSASFLLDSKNHMDSVLHINFSFGNNGGPILDIPKVDIKNGCLEEILTNKLKGCSRDFEVNEIRIIAEIGKSALENSSVYNQEDTMSLDRVISELYYLAYNECIKHTKNVLIPEENDSLATITLIDDTRYGECICINDKRKVFDEVLEFIGCNWSVMDLKKTLRDKGYLVTDNGNPYTCIIQTNKAKALGVRKIVKIPVKRVQPFVEAIKKQIKENEERQKKILNQKKTQEIEDTQLKEENIEKHEKLVERRRLQAKCPKATQTADADKNQEGDLKE